MTAQRWNGLSQRAVPLQRLQERDQFVPLEGTQRKAEFMPAYRAPRDTGRSPASRRMYFLEAVRIEHLVEACNRTVMEIVPAVPESLQRRHLVISRAFPCSQRQTLVGVNR